MDIFKPASEEEKARRNKEKEKLYAEFVENWIEKFKNRDDVVQNSDGSYTVNGDIIEVGPNVIKEFPVKIKEVNGNIIMIDLQSLNNFPEAVNGQIFLLDSEFKREDIKCGGWSSTMRGGIRIYPPQCISE